VRYRKDGEKDGEEQGKEEKREIGGREWWYVGGGRVESAEGWDVRAEKRGEGGVQRRSGEEEGRAQGGGEGGEKGWGDYKG